MKFTRFLFLLVLPLYLLSCGTQKKLPAGYLDRITDTSGTGEVKIPVFRFQKNDILNIQIYSASTRSEIDDLYNLRATIISGGQAAPTTGFLIDANGNIEYPRLGTFHAEGLTKEELAAQIKKRLTQPVELLTDPTVIIRFQNFKVTVIGEVKSPGQFSIPGERITILEALGLAGDIDEYGIKDGVKVIREVDGKKAIGVIDLSSDSLFISPYYNLVQNDVVMVLPNKKKLKKTDQDLVVQRVTFGLSIITAMALIFNVFKK